MDNSLRFPAVNLAAAVIIGASLIISASIVAHKPKALAVPASSPVDARPRLAPPIAQDAVASQFREQVRSAPDVRTRKSNGQTYTLTDVRVKQVIYSAKNDNFTVVYDWVWNPPMARPDADLSILTNDGYGHYYGSAVFGGIYDGGSIHSADVTVR